MPSGLIALALGGSARGKRHRLGGPRLPHEGDRVRQLPGMITRVTDAAHGAALAASANVSASNVGNALGAWLGGLAISARLGYTAPLYVAAGIVLVSVAVMVVAAQQARPHRAADRVPAR